MLRIGLILITLALSCRGCHETRKFSEPEELPVSSRPYEIEVASLFDWHKGFMFSSKMELTLINEGEQSLSREWIEANGFDGQLHLSKKIDDAHYFEIFTDQESYLVKNRQGEWRENKDNKLFLRNLIKDSLNINDWMVEQLALGEFLIKNDKESTPAKNVYVLRNAQIKAEAPFWVSLFRSSPDFKQLKSAQMSGVIEMDAAKKLPIYSTFLVEASLENGHRLRLSAETKLSPISQKPFTKPQAVKDGPLLYPVNIAPKFNELMGSKPDGGAHEK